MRRLVPLLLALLALLAPGGPAPAQFARPGGNHMNVSLVAEQAVIAPGSTVTLAFVMRPERGLARLLAQSRRRRRRAARPMAAARRLDRRRRSNIRCRTG